MWINIGSYTLDPESHTLPSPTDTCPVTNTTLPPATDTEIAGIGKLYTLSYLWLSSVGVATCVVVGLVVSFATGPMKPDQIDKKYLIPIFDRLFCCLPDKILSKCRCGSSIEKEDEGDELDVTSKPKAKSVTFRRNQVAPVDINVDSGDQVQSNSESRDRTRPSAEDLPESHDSREALEQTTGGYSEQ